MTVRWPDPSSTDFRLCTILQIWCSCKHGRSSFESGPRWVSVYVHLLICIIIILVKLLLQICALIRANHHRPRAQRWEACNRGHDAGLCFKVGSRVSSICSFMNVNVCPVCSRPDRTIIIMKAFPQNSSPPEHNDSGLEVKALTAAETCVDV